MAVAPPAVLPATSTHTASVIFLHHSGANGLSWAKRFEAFRLPHVKYVFPNASMVALTLYDGVKQTAWFDVMGYTPNSPTDADGIHKSVATMYELIEKEIEGGIPSERILVGGCSQGGCIAMFGGVTYGKPLAGLVGMNSWLPYFREITAGDYNPANKEVPILQMNSDGDPFIPVRYAKLASDALKSFDSRHTYTVYKNNSHWPSEQMFEDMKNFVTKWLPD